MSIVEHIKAQMAPGNKGGGTRRDAVVEVVGYNLEKSTIHVKEGDREFNIAIHSKAYKPNEAEMDEAAKFMGSTIDARMQKNLPVGERIILEGLDDYGADLNGKPQPVQWISSATVDPEKLLSGIVTLRGYSKSVEVEGKKSVEHKVNAVHLWQDKSYGTESLDDFAARFDGVFKYHADAKAAREADGTYSPVKPSLGFALRTIVEGEVVAYTPVVDYNPSTKLPPSGQDLKEAFDEWNNLAKANFGESAAVEFAVCRVYRAGNNFKMQNPGPGAMIGTKASYDASGEMPPYGNSVLAGNALLRLSTGKYNQKGQLEGAEHDWANTVYCSSKKHHLHEMIKDSSGQELKLTEGIVITYPSSKAKQEAPEQAQDQNAQQANTEAPAAQAQAAAPAQSSAPDEEDEMDKALAAATRNIQQGGTPQPS